MTSKGSNGDRGVAKGSNGDRGVAKGSNGDRGVAKGSAAVLGVKGQNLLNMNQYLTILDRMDSGYSMQEVCDEFNIFPSTFHNINKNRDELIRYASKINSVADERAKKVRLAKCAELDRRVYEWYKEEQEEGREVTPAALLESARHMAQFLSMFDFTATTGWLTAFKEKHDIRIQDKESSQPPSVRKCPARLGLKLKRLKMKEKLEVLRHIEAGDTRQKIIEEFSIPSSTYYDIKKQRHTLKEYAETQSQQQDDAPPPGDLTIRSFHLSPRHSPASGTSECDDVGKTPKCYPSAKTKKVKTSHSPKTPAETSTAGYSLATTSSIHHKTIEEIDIKEEVLDDEEMQEDFHLFSDPLQDINYVDVAAQSCKQEPNDEPDLTKKHNSPEPQNLEQVVKNLVTDDSSEANCRDPLDQLGASFPGSTLREQSPGASGSPFHYDRPGSTHDNYLDMGTQKTFPEKTETKPKNVRVKKKQSKVKDTQDPDAAFAEYVRVFLSKMNKQHKHKAKMAIMEALHTCEEEAT